MLPIKLLNIPCSDMTGCGINCGIHIYPFFDAVLKEKYDQIPLLLKPKAVDLHTSNPALQGTWFNVKVTQFSTNARSTVQ